MHLKMSSAKWRPFVSASMCLSVVKSLANGSKTELANTLGLKHRVNEYIHAIGNSISFMCDVFNVLFWNNLN